MTDVLRGLTIVVCALTIALGFVVTARWAKERNAASVDDRKVLRAAVAVQVCFMLISMTMIYARIEQAAHNIPSSYRDVFAPAIAVTLLVTEYLILKTETLWRPKS